MSKSGAVSDSILGGSMQPTGAGMMAALFGCGSDVEPGVHRLFCNLFVQVVLSFGFCNTIAKIFPES